LYGVRVYGGPGGGSEHIARSMRFCTGRGWRRCITDGGDCDGLSCGRYIWRERMKKFLKNQKGTVVTVLLVIGAHICLGSWIIHWAKIDYQRKQECRECQERLEMAMQRADPNGPDTAKK
jgi:hypothetical protein